MAGLSRLDIMEPWFVGLGAGTRPSKMSSLSKSEVAALRRDVRCCASQPDEVSHRQKSLKRPGTARCISQLLDVAVAEVSLQRPRIWPLLAMTKPKAWRSMDEPESSACACDFSPSTRAAPACGARSYCIRPGAAARRLDALVCQGLCDHARRCGKPVFGQMQYAIVDSSRTKALIHVKRGGNSPSGSLDLPVSGLFCAISYLLLDLPAQVGGRLSTPICSGLPVP
jgi:hypothetical protein